MTDSVDVWIVVAVLTATTLAIRASGPVILGGRDLAPGFGAVVELLAPALLAALIVSQTIGGEDGLDVDARIAGVAAAGVVLAWRHSAMLTAMAVAALLTAALRALA